VNKLLFKLQKNNNGIFYLGIPKIYGITAIDLVILGGVLLYLGFTSGFWAIILGLLAGGFIVSTYGWHINPKENSIKKQQFLGLMTLESYRFEDIENFILVLDGEKKPVRYILGLVPVSGERVFLFGDTFPEVRDWAWKLSKECHIPLGIEGYDHTGSMEDLNQHADIILEDQLKSNHAKQDSESQVED
jgi:hypothetical protein